MLPAVIVAYSPKIVVTSSVLPGAHEPGDAEDLSPAKIEVHALQDFPAGN